MRKSRSPAIALALWLLIPLPCAIAQSPLPGTKPFTMEGDPAAEGLLLEPDAAPKARIVAIPDADWTPEMLAGMSAGVDSSAQFARRLAESGCQVLIPTLIDRKDTWSGIAGVKMTNLPHRE